MNTEHNDGGPAFPHPNAPDELPFLPGMSLRDWFAGQALSGLLCVPQRSGTSREFADDAYTLADAMLAARERKG